MLLLHVRQHRLTSAACWALSSKPTAAACSRQMTKQTDRQTDARRLTMRVRLDGVKRSPDDHVPAQHIPQVKEVR